MCNICRLCKKNKKLAESHLVPKMFFREIKQKSITGGMRLISNPNKRLQDGIKLPFLCHECEQRFSKYEKFFSDNYFSQAKKEPLLINEYHTRSDELKYFILSVSWRCLQYIYETDTDMLKDFTFEEKKELENILEQWRVLLYSENLKEIRKIQMHLIPTNKLNILDEKYVYDNVAFDFRIDNQENTFKYAYEYIKVPYFIFLCTVWGNTNHMKQLLVGKTIKITSYNLPYFLKDLIFKHLSNFELSKSQLSDKQKKFISDKAKRNTLKNK